MAPPWAGEGVPDPSSRWDRSDLTRLWPLLSLVVSLAVAAVTASTTSCNAHEVGHVIVGTAVGWEVERINLCLPAAGSVDYSDASPWAGNVQGYAGGLVATGFLVAVYSAMIARRRRPLQSPAWWAAGLGLVAPIGGQLVVAGMEGSAGPGEDYRELFQDLPHVFYPLLLLSSIAVVSLYVWRWRAVWQSPTQPVE